MRTRPVRKKLHKMWGFFCVQNSPQSQWSSSRTDPGSGLQEASLLCVASIIFLLAFSGFKLQLKRTMRFNSE